MNIIEELPPEISKHIPIKQVILQQGIATKAESLCANLGRALLICDENTKDFLKIPAERIILPGNQKPELAKARELALNSPDYFIALGSGSLNDLVKYAAFLANKPYIVFGTACSMNGYASANVSLLENGYKKSFLARAPQIVYLDSEILKNAPRRLTNAGIGDSICRSTVEADAALSHQATASPQFTELFELLRKYEDKIFDDIEALAKTLIFGGIAMLAGGSSAPASQSEHMLAHYMELMQPTAPHSLHGEQIAVTTITMSKLQERLLLENDYIEIQPLNEGLVLKHFGDEFGKYCLQQSHKKYSGLYNRKIKINKPAIEKNMVRSEIIIERLKSTGAPVSPSSLGWDEAIYGNAATYTKYTRDRFTFLDLL